MRPTRHTWACTSSLHNPQCAAGCWFVHPAPAHTAVVSLTVTVHVVERDCAGLEVGNETQRLLPPGEGLLRAESGHTCSRISEAVLCMCAQLPCVRTSCSSADMVTAHTGGCHMLQGPPAHMCDTLYSVSVANLGQLCPAHLYSEDQRECSSCTCTHTSPERCMIMLAKDHGSCTAHWPEPRTCPRPWVTTARRHHKLVDDAVELTCCNQGCSVQSQWQQHTHQLCIRGQCCVLRLQGLHACPTGCCCCC